jgi:hypothetical protein
MAAEILHISLGRLERAGRLRLTTEPQTTLVQFERVAQTFRAVEMDVPVAERPPLLNVPGYLARRSSTSWINRP